MAAEKLPALRQSHPLHPHPEQVRDPLFTAGSPFFDPRDLVQVKYTRLRRVRGAGDSGAPATALVARARPTFYAAHAASERSGLVGWWPEPTGPRHGHKLTAELLELLEPRASSLSSTELAAWLREEQPLSVPPRRIAGALKRAAKKGGPS